MISALLLLATVPQAAEPEVRRTAAVVRTDESLTLDGRLDEAIWRSAPVIGPLRQMRPRIDAEPSEATEVRIVHDGKTLWFGIRCFDREPHAIVATLRQRDADLDPDDRIEILLDTFQDRRNAYFFQIGAAGSIGDALVARDGAGFKKAWDGIFEGAARIDELGWSAEIAIPFATVAFDPSKEAWGFNLNRCIKRREEFSRFAGFARDASFFQIAQAGDLAGMVGIEQGLGIDLVPFFTAHHDDPRGDAGSLTGQLGFDAFWRITPGLQAAVTYNTDFAETEVDDRRVNLTRFPLFFPEKRDFFLQDAGIFDFADLDSGLLLPFFSRRIGLDGAGNQVPILVGGKLTGRAGDWNVGLLDVQTEDGAALDGENLGVARVSRNLGEQSSVGVIGTLGDPRGETDAALYGADLNLGTRTFRGDKNLRSSLWVLRSDDGQESGDDLAYGASLRYPNDLWSWKASAAEVQERFDPRLGFLPRRGIRDYQGEIEFAPRSEGWVREWEFEVAGRAVTDLDDRLETGEIEIQPLGVELDSGDEARLQLIWTRERLDQAFEIEDGIAIPAGEYDFTRLRLELESSQKRPLSAGLELEGGEFFDGTRFDFEPSLLWRPNALLNASLSYERSAVDLEAGEFTAHVGRARVDLTFTPRLQWSNLVQFDNDSDSAGWNSRLRWIFGPGQELFLVWNTVVEREAGSLVSTGSAAAFKVGYTLRF